MLNKHEREKHDIAKVFNITCENIDDNKLIERLKNLYNEWHSDETQEKPDFIIGNNKDIGIEHCAVSDAPAGSDVKKDNIHRMNDKWSQDMLKYLENIDKKQLIDKYMGVESFNSWDTFEKAIDGLSNAVKEIIENASNPVNIKHRNIAAGLNWDNKNHIESLFSVIKKHCEKSKNYAKLSETYLIVYDYNSFQLCDPIEQIVFIIDIYIAGCAKLCPKFDKIIYCNVEHKWLMTSKDEEIIIKMYSQ